MRDFFVPGRSPVAGLNAAAASSHPLATGAALRVLGDGGNAVDAAVTATFVLCVVEPQSTGLGGDCFALISRRGVTPPIGFNGSGRSSASLSLSEFDSSAPGRLRETDVHTVTVPGLVEGLARILADHGTFDLARCLAPAIGYAEEGFPVHQKVAFDWSGAVWKLAADRDAAQLYLPSGSAPLPGQVFRNPHLAGTLRSIAEEGAGVFYSGRIAESMLASLRRRGSFQEFADFDKHRGAYVEPISAPYGDWTVWQIPPNGQGATTLLILSILELLGFGAEDPRSLRYHDVLAKAARLAMRERDRHIADPEHGEIDLSPFLDRAYARGLVHDGERRPASPQRTKATALGDTAYVTVVDKQRNSVSLISSLFENFGCGLADAATGIVFHCRGAGFTLEPGHPNRIGPAKRPLHTIIPGMVSEGKRVVLSFGVTGGHFQPIGQSCIISAMHDRGLDIQAAIDAPRSFFREGKLALEPALGQLAEELMDSGHVVSTADAAIGGAHGVSIDWTRGVLTAGSDHRKDGLALAV
jgi:gamma-glutamyltranspeptidase/glutathione hydrolase